jgi:hypothetical protein
MMAALRYDYDQAKVTAYRDSAMELHALRQRVKREFDSAVTDGNKQAARSALDQLKASRETFKELRSTLSPTDLFIAKYNIQVHGPHEVSFVLPKGVSRYEMLCEAQGLVAERDNCNLVWPDRLKEWERDKTFKATTTTPERIQIDGHVEGGDGMNRANQETFLKSKGLPQANLEDLAAAFVGYWVATGEPLFGWYDKPGQWSFVVRAAGGVLSFGSDGLHVYGIDGADSNSFVAVSSRVPRNSKN